MHELETAINVYDNWCIIDVFYQETPGLYKLLEDVMAARPDSDNVNVSILLQYLASAFNGEDLSLLDR